jgi:hypothetical protein
MKHAREQGSHFMPFSQRRKFTNTHKYTTVPIENRPTTAMKGTICGAKGVNTVTKATQYPNTSINPFMSWWYNSCIAISPGFNTPS